VAGEEIQAQKKSGEGEGAAKAAFLVIHGIGQQHPFETLDGFVRGLHQALLRKTGRPWTIRHDLLNFNGSTESRLYLSSGKTEGNKKEEAGAFDLYEVCWAPLTQRQISYPQVLRFLQSAALSPLRYFATNLEFLSEEKKAGRRTHSTAWLIGRELLRIGLIYLPVFFLIIALGAFLSDVSQYQDLVSTLATSLREALPKGGVAWTLFYAELLLWILLFVTGKSLWDLTKHPASKSINRRAELKWRKALAIFFVLFALLLIGKVGIEGSSLRPLVTHASRSLRIGVVALLLFAWTKGVLVDFIGDITIYVNMDENSEFFKTRNAILGEAADKLRWILRQKQYEQVFVAGHSLGSVVAHNAINKLLLEADQAGNDSSELTWKETAKIKLLVTFGSPLDKVYYFFRTHVQSDQAIRAQILSDRYPFARRHSRPSHAAGRIKETSWVREYGDLTFVDPPSPLLLYPDQKMASPSFSWLNFWYPTDPVSGHLNFYDPERLQNVKLDSPLRRFGRAHLDYWSDPDFYNKILEEIDPYGKIGDAHIERAEPLPHQNDRVNQQI